MRMNIVLLTYLFKSQIDTHVLFSQKGSSYLQIKELCHRVMFVAPVSVQSLELKNKTKQVFFQNTVTGLHSLQLYLVG